MEHTVSIIIPVYKVEEYVERCLQSLFEQTYTHSELECILVDDCSPDGSMDVVRRVIDTYQGGMSFVILRHDENKGLSEARNTGIRHATGKYLFFVDSDDYITPDCIKLHMEEVDKHPNVEVVSANFFHDKFGGGLTVQINKIPNYIDNHSLIFRLYLRDILPMTAWNVLIREDIIRKNDLWFGNRLVQEDLLWSFHLYRCTSQMAFCPEVTYRYCDNKDSIMNVMKCNKPIVISYYRMLSNICNHFDKLYYIDIVLFCERMLWRGADYASADDVDIQSFNNLMTIRDFLLRKTIKDRRFVLAFSLLLLYKPYSNIRRFYLFRRYYDRHIECVRRFALLFNFLH